MKSVAVFGSLLLCVCGAFAQDAAHPAYLDPSKPTEQRIADLISRMTLEEKAQQLNHLNAGIPRLNVSAWGGWNQTLHGVWSKQPTTLFPAPIAMGATWDPTLVHTIKSVAVIGPAEDTAYETGNYYGTPARKVSPVQGLKDALGADVKVEYEQGAGFVEPADQSAIARAADLARKSDVAILFLGTNLKVESEGHDRKDLNLPDAQEQLLEAVYAANPKTVLVLMNAGPLAVTWANDHLPAILDAWYPGEAGGTAIAQVLLGDYNPGGHLPNTVYASLDGVPPPNEYDVSKGFTYLYFKGIPLYPFGHGLSYTQFRHSHLKLSQTGISTTGLVTVSFDLQNTGSRAGSEVAQLYVHQQKSTVVQPFKSLRGFQRVALDPGETRHISLALPATALSYYDVVTHRFIVAPGMFDVMIGSSSIDIRLRTQLKVH